MNFQSFGVTFGMKVAIVAIVGSGLSAIAPMSSAQAAAITAGQTITFNGDARLLNENDAIATLDFLPNYSSSPDGQARAGSTSDIGANSQFQIQDLNLTKIATGWQYLNAAGLDWFNLAGVTYKLTSFDLWKTASGGFEAAIDGMFSPGNLVTDNGAFSSQKRFATFKGTTFSAELTAGSGRSGGVDDGTLTPVPTPALLPGLIGLGATIVRKRRTSAIAA
jgi:hypothetical protein